MLDFLSDYSRIMKKEPLIPWAYISAFIRTAGLQGVPLDDILSTLDYGLLDEGKFLPGSKLDALCEKVLEHASFNTLLPITSVMGFEGLAELPTIALFEKTPRDVINSVIKTKLPRYYGIHARLEDNKDTTSLILDMGAERSPLGRRHATEWTLGLIAQLSTNTILGDNGIPIIAIHLDYDPGEDMHEYKWHNSPAIKVSQKDTRIITNRSALDTVKITVPTAIAMEAQKKLTQKIHNLADTKTPQNIETLVAEAIKENISADSTTSGVNIESIAKTLNFSTRSLQRKLSEKDLNFTDIKRETLVNEAKTLLNSSSMSLDNIADALGFSDRSTLSSAFKKSTGISPAQFRKKQ